MPEICRFYGIWRACGITRRWSRRHRCWLQPKIREYLDHGVERVWVIDPDERRALSYSAGDPGGTLVDELRTQNPDITIPLARATPRLQPSVGHEISRASR